MAMYLGGQAVKIIAPSINLFDKSLIRLNSEDFTNCSEYELSADKNTIIARGKSDSANPSDFQSSCGWVAVGQVASRVDGKGIKLKKGDIVTVSADITLIEKGDRSAAVRCYLYSRFDQVYEYGKYETKSISETKQRLTWAFTILKDGSTFYPVFPINSNKVKIENISVNKVKNYWRIRSGVYMGRNPKNLIPFPYYNASQTINGITFTVNKDGTVTINGTPTVATSFKLSVKTVNLKSNTTYSLSGIPKGMNDNDNKFYFNLEVFKDGAVIKNVADRGDGNVFTCDGDYVSSLTLWIGAGTTVDNITLKPMLNEGTRALPYFYYD